MTHNEMLAVDGVFLAVKCAICEAVYAADSDEYLAFYGSVGAGLSKVLVGVDPPRKPAKKAMRAVCRTPHCLETLVRQMLGCADGERGDADVIWAEALGIWARSAKVELLRPAGAAPETTPAQRKLAARARARGAG